MESAACLPRSGFVQQINAADAKSSAADFGVIREPQKKGEQIWQNSEETNLLVFQFH